VCVAVCAVLCVEVFVSLCDPLQQSIHSAYDRVAPVCLSMCIHTRRVLDSYQKGPKFTPKETCTHTKKDDIHNKKDLNSYLRRILFKPKQTYIDDNRELNSYGRRPVFIPKMTFIHT